MVGVGQLVGRQAKGRKVGEYEGGESMVGRFEKYGGMIERQRRGIKKLQRWFLSSEGILEHRAL